MTDKLQSNLRDGDRRSEMVRLLETLESAMRWLTNPSKDGHERMKDDAIARDQLRKAIKLCRTMTAQTEYRREPSRVTFERGTGD